ncbi:MAG TPA: sigma-70 family RNA polymerase sigma factor [Bryobacteraceae bacterium]|nr:sigma-70 family RNA polymerase sigma factor [Bryobacteraceae bacterium]
MGGTESIPAGQANQDALYREAANHFGPALERVARAYEADSENRRDLSQDIHFQLWRSFQRYDSRCSLRTWVYRVAHHVAVSHVVRERRTFSNLVGLEELEATPDKADAQAAANQRMDLNRLSALIQRLKPLDRQVIISYLEDMDAASIGEITGLSPANVAMKIHRIKNILAKQFHEKRHEGDIDAG